MHITSLSVSNFRNYGESSVDFTEDTNIICGGNAAGKTNLLEAIFCFAAGKSFRNCRDGEMIRFGCDRARSELKFVSGGVEKKLVSEFARNEKRVIRLGESPPLKMSEYLGLFRAVVFTPDHLGLIKGSPVFRRRFLDIAICQSFPRYAGTLSEYNRIIAQKNALLRRGLGSGELLEVYNEKAAQSAALITVNRRKYISRLEGEAGSFLRELSKNSEEMSITYQSQAGEAETKEEIAEKYREIFETHASREREKSVSLYGAHKDDFSVGINKKSARLFASQGQQRSCVLALKLAEGELSACLTGEYPVFLLDDILSELDADRREFILSRLKDRQVIITGCERELFGCGGNIIRVEGGKACTCN